MQKNRFERWLQTIQSTQEQEISCSECFDLVSHFVELELSGADAAVQMPQLRQHLIQCPACHQEYETLRDLQQLEDKGQDLSIDDLKDMIP
jgi:Zn finger protein HypA/HybF involved in hydrogenase expression